MVSAAAGRARGVLSGIVLTLAVLLLPVTILGNWVDNTISDTDRYVSTVAPLAEDPAVQEVAATRLTDAVMGVVDDQRVLADLVDRIAANRDLPPRLVELARVGLGALRSQLEERVSDAAHRLVVSDAFGEGWRTANETAHLELVALLRDDSDLVVTQDGTLSLNLATVADAIIEVLVDNGLTVLEQLPPVDVALPITDASQVEALRGYYGLLHSVATWTLIGMVAALAVGLALARRRHAAAVRTVAGAVLAVLAVLALIAVGRSLLLDQLPATASVEATGATYDILLDRLRVVLRTVGLVLLVALAVLVVASPGERGRAMRATVAARATRGWEAARSRTWPAVVGAVVAVGGVLLLLLGSPGPALALGTLVVVLLGGALAAALVRSGTASP